MHLWSPDTVFDNIITNGAQVSAFVQANKNIISSANLAITV